jgi:predicted membrane-bound mannosyltransferase
MDSLGRRPLKLLTGLILLAFTGQLATQAWRAAIEYAADPRNPYVYAQTSPDILNLVEHVKAVSASSPQRNRMLIQVIAPENEYWPLPWYLRQFDRVGWYDRYPSGPHAPVVVVSTHFPEDLEAEKTHASAGRFELRPQTFFELYVADDLWRAYLSKQNANPSAGK